MKGKYFEFMSLVGSYLKSTDKDKSENENQFDQFLRAEMIEHCAQMHANGYEGISPKSKDLLEQKIIEKIKESPSQYIYFLHIYGNFSNEFKVKCITESKSSNIDAVLSYIKDDLNNPDFNHLVKEMIFSKLDNIVNGFTKNIVLESTSVGNVGSGNRIKVTHFYNKLNYLSDLLEKISNGDNVSNFNHFVDKLIELKEKQNKFVKKVNDRLFEQYHDGNFKEMQQEKLEELLEKVKSKIKYYSTEKAEDIIKKLKKESLKLETDALNKKLINELPNGAKQLSQEIKSKYESLSVDVEIALKFDLDKRLEDMNKIIKKYLSLDLDYRDSLKNVQGKSAYDLMLESLNTVNADFDKLIKENNQVIVNEISALNRKSMSKKIF